jgi:hypothetical protein
MAFSTKISFSTDIVTGPTGDRLGARGHATMHNNIGTILNELQDKIGVDSSADTSSLDYKLTNSASISPGHKHSVTDINDLSASAAELNILHGVTATTSQMNYLTGVSSNIQTQIDTKQSILTDSAGLRSALSDETGTGVAVFNDSPTILTPTIASFTNATHTHQNTAGGGQLSLTAAVTGTLPVANGGTGQSSYIDGELLIGNSATGLLSKAVLIAGSNITITNGNGTITIASSGGGGGTSLTVQEEGSDLAQRDKMNFIGAGITASDDSGNARTNVTLDATLNSLSALGTASDKIAYTTGVDTWAETAITSFGRSIIDDTDASAVQTTLGLVIGTNVQAYDADLTTLAGLTATTDNFIVSVASAWASRTPSQVRTTLGLVIGTNVQAWDADLDTLAGLTATTDNFIVSVSSAWASRTPSQVRTTLGLVIGTNVQAWDADLDTLAGKTIPSGATLADTTSTQTFTNKTLTTPILTKPTINGSLQGQTVDADGATITFDLTNNIHEVILGGNRTLAISNISVGQFFKIDLIQDGTGSRTVTWFASNSATATVTIAAPGVLTTGVDIPTLTPIVLTTTGALPTGLTASTVYYYTRVDATTGKLSTTVANAQAGTFITTSGSQSGTHTCAVQLRWPGQTAPVLSTGKFLKDSFGFNCVRTGVIDAYIIQQGL